jgi:hypothetical protein
MTNPVTSVRDTFLERTALENMDLRDVVNAIKAIPHGRPRERSASGVVQDWRGTCSTKLLLLRALFPDLPMRFYNRVFTLSREAARVRLGPAVAEVVPRAGMIDVHTFARVEIGGRWVRIDLAFPGEAWDGHSDMSDPWGDGEDFDADLDPIAHKESLIERYGDPAVRARFIEAISA